MDLSLTSNDGGALITLGLGFIGLLFLLVVLPTLLNRKGASKKNELLEKIASDLGLNLQKGNFLKGSSLSGNYSGRQLEIMIAPNIEAIPMVVPSKPLVPKQVYDVTSATPFLFSIKVSISKPLEKKIFIRCLYGSGMSQQMGGTPLSKEEFGNPEFDEKFHISTVDKMMAKKIINDQIQKEFIKLENIFPKILKPIVTLDHNSITALIKFKTSEKQTFTDAIKLMDNLANIIEKN